MRTLLGDLRSRLRNIAAEPKAEDAEAEDAEVARLRHELDHWKKTADRRGKDLNRALETSAEDAEVARLRHELDHWKKTADRRGKDLNRALETSAEVSEQALTVRRRIAGMVRAEADEWQVKGEDYRRFPAEVSAERAWVARAEDLRVLAHRIEAES